LIVPFDSITGFTDPSVPFGFKLEPRAPEPAAGRAPATAEIQESAPAPAPAKTASAKPPSGPAPAKSGQRAEKPAEPAGEAKVVSIDAFRKK
jgi:hypothetical protein